MQNTIKSAKAKLIVTLSTSTENKERLKRACSTGLETTLGIAKQVAGSVGVPGLQAGIGGLLFVLDVVKKSYQNAEDIEQLAQHIVILTAVLQNSKDKGTLSAVIIGRIDQLSTKWSVVTDEVRQMASRHVVARVVRYNDDAQAISSLIRTISWLIQSFTVETMLAIEFTLDEQRDSVIRIEGKVDNVAEKIDGRFQAANAKLDVKDGHPPHAIFARFDCKERARCFEGTRVDILNQVYRWIDTEDFRIRDTVDLERSPDGGGATDAATEILRIFWVNGSAGTGKSTIAFTIAEACRKRGILGASFFCSRDDVECSSPNLIFSTIAYQLGQFFPLFSAEVARALKSNPDIGYSSVPYQLQELIVKPLRAVRISFPPCVIVLDALDECKDSGTTSVILSSLSRHVAELSPLKILLTSRPERNIATAFKSSELAPATERFILHEIALGIVEDDIGRYLATSLTLIRDSYELECLWPLEADIRSLAHLAFGLFIFAATSVKFIEDRNYSNPRGQLVDLLRNASTVVEISSSPQHHLDRLYTQVLTHAFPNMASSLVGRLKMVLGTIVLLRNPLSSVALEALLTLRASTVRETLVHLHSVIIVPEHDTKVIRLLHPSFFDFITNPTRCRNPKFAVNATTQHTLLSRACLDTMKELRRDICGIRNPAMLNNEVEDFSTRIVRYIPPHLRYACRHWAFHLARAMISDALLDAVTEFSSKYLLYWVEACSLLGELRSAILALDDAQQALVNSGRDMTYVKSLLHDCDRLIREFFQILGVSSLQVYHSVLLFVPKQTPLYETYRHELVLPMTVHDASQKTWNTCMRIIEGHTGNVHSVAFSSDGTRVVSGSSDRTLRLWDTVNGAHLNTLTGHSDIVTSVAISGDGARIVSGSGDHTLRLWDAVSGVHLLTLTGHESSVLSVKFSPDGRRVASGSSDHTLRLWDVVGGASLNTLTGHSSAILSVAFSPDGKRVVSGSDDKSLRLWDVGGAHLNTLTGHYGWVRSVAFSPDGGRVLSGSDDKTLRLWDAVSGAHLNTLTGHSFAVFSATFSPDGSHVMSGSSDGTIRLWDAVSGVHLNTLTGHPCSVLSVTFSHDGTRVISGSTDNTLRLWDAVSNVYWNTLTGHSPGVRSASFSPGGTHILSRLPWGKTLQRLPDAATGAHLNALTGHSGRVTSIAFSPDGMFVVSGSEDHTVKLWDAVSGVHLNTLKGHHSTVWSVTFSPDGLCVVSGCEDRTLRLWDAVSGIHLNTLMGHESSVSSVAFSPDGTRVVSGSSDNTLRLWDAVSGAHLNTLMGHSGYVRSATFSPDGMRVLSASDDTTLQLWDAVSGVHLNTFVGHSGTVYSAAFSPDGTRIVSGSMDETLLLWDAVSGARLQTFRGHPKFVLSLAFSPDGMCLVSTCLDNPSLDTAKDIHFDTFTGYVTAAAYSLDLSQPSLPQSDPVRSISTCPPKFGYVIEDGWIFSVPQKRRLCWIPVSCRPHCLAWNGNRLALGTNTGQIVILDFNGMTLYLDAL